ncbi:mechanosensitive ion channel domain-containing protein [uncultured Thermanaerothrix sp.]|uniref:mechanosensitive ion channel family protein n=1 Tax=uncultured Thermanaerothrix sp. TaxID=1195149 RepID=UPI002605DC5E|nr:mechanosensitive ion channel domain-containing protein [uncultured Thermanaerothrix sp.]
MREWSWLQIITLLVKPVFIALLAILAQRLSVAGFRSLETRLLQRWAVLPERKGRIHTLIKLGQHTVNVVIVTLALLMVLHTLGINILPLLTGAGVLGLALSLGTQTLVRDVINGIFILLEGQFELGDTIQVGDHTGVVEQMTLRVTHLRDEKGNLHILPNGDIRMVVNLNRSRPSTISVQEPE